MTYFDRLLSSVCLVFFYHH